MNAVERRRAEERLSFLEALVTANERRTEVLATVETSEDTQEAAARVAELLGLDPARALAVLDCSYGDGPGPNDSEPVRSSTTCARCSPSGSDSGGARRGQLARRGERPGARLVC